MPPSLGSRPANRRVGNVTKVPPPASEFRAPPRNAAAMRMMVVTSAICVGWGVRQLAGLPYHGATRSSYLSEHQRLVSRSGRPLGLVAQGDGRLARLRDDLGMVEGGEFSAATQDATVDYHGVHVRRQAERNDRLIRVACGRHVDVGRAKEDEVGALAVRNRTRAIGNAEI